MTTKKTTQKKKGISPLTVAVTGAVIGAGVATAGVVAIQDEKKRKAVKDALVNVKNHAIDYAENIKLPTNSKLKKLNKNTAKREVVKKIKASGKTSKSKE